MQTKIAHIKEVLAKIETCKTIIAKERDKLRGINDDLVDLMDSLDRGVHGLESGKREIEDGLDSLSEYL